MKYSEVMAGSQHFIFIVDENGIAVTYPEIKQRVVEKQDSHVSVISFSENEHYLFMKEMNILHNHFPDRFLSYFEVTATLQPGLEPQETIESVINENTRVSLHFVVAGRDSFIDLVQAYLSFLGIESSIISSLKTEE
jgi:hypothetical protein